MDLTVHVLVDIMNINDGIDFEGDSIIPTPASHPFQTFQVFASFVTGLNFVAIPVTANQMIGLGLKTVARNGQNVEIFTESNEPVFGDEAAIADDTDAGQSQFPLAELNELAQIAAFLMNKRLSTREVDLFHSCVKVRIKQ
jgi:hypothetical protein